MESAPYDVRGPVTVKLEDQLTGLQPGMHGYWKVYGARAMDIRPGDLVMASWKDDDADGGAHHIREYEVARLDRRGDLWDTVRVFFITTTGREASVGMLQPMQLLRPGTHNVLADSI